MASTNYKRPPARLFKDSDTAIEYARREYISEMARRSILFKFALDKVRKGIQIGIFE